MTPLHPPVWISYVLAIASGFGFGFVLERAGFGSSRLLAAQFYLKNMTVLKVMFTAIVTAMLGLTLLRSVGVVDYDAVYVNPTFLWPQILGGIIFGVGFVVGGYCPGTSVVAAVTGKIDGLVFLAGSAAGILIYSGIYPRIASFANAGGERKQLTDWLHLPYGVIAIGVTLMALGMFFGAEWLERKLGGKPAEAPSGAQKASS